VIVRRHLEIEVEEDLLEGQVSGSALTPMVLRKLARSFWFEVSLRLTAISAV